MSDWVIDRVTQWDRHQINHQIKLSPKTPKNPQYERHVLQGRWRWWWSCVEEHRWCVVLLLLQCCSTGSMNEWINQSMKKKRMKVSESGWWLMSDWVIDWLSDSMRSASNQSANQTLSQKPQESSIWETRTLRLMEVMVELCWRASLMSRAPSAPILLDRKSVV